ncbi:glycoprotease family-domain-containing protein [Xylaria sp. FL0043]|nr:glycoprotease family-domain-containing protein [Xylaria sp. FL0043]
MSRLWNSSRQCLPVGSLFLPRAQSRIIRLPPSFSASSSSPCSRPGSHLPHQPRRSLLTLAIETSCDDTCVAILEKSKTGAARLHFNEKITSDNREHGGVHPLVAATSHTQKLAPLVQKALRSLPAPKAETGGAHIDSPGEEGINADGKVILVDGQPLLRPDFVSATRGPGMMASLGKGLNLAKGLAVAWDVPLLAVNHMQAHALTPWLVSALERQQQQQNGDQQVRDTSEGAENQNEHHKKLEFPFLSLLVSGGHTMLVRSRSLNDHAIIAKSLNIAAGDMIDKCARIVVPPEIIEAEDCNSGMYGPILEEFVFPGSRESGSYDYYYTAPARRADEIKKFDSGYGWTLTPPLSLEGKGEEAASRYEFAGINGQIQKLLNTRPDMVVDMRRVLGRAAMTLVFEHLTSRIVFALQADDAKQTGNGTDTEQQGKIKTVVLSGGVASNKFLRHVVRKMLDARGYADVEVVAPPVSLCTDNAAMIAWAGMEMYESGWRSDLGVMSLRKWPLDPNAEGGGILGASGWYKVPETKG